MEITKDLLSNILDAYPYEIIFVDRNHIIQYMNKTAKERYINRIQIGHSIFNCHNQESQAKIEAFLQRADNGEDEMFEAYNTKTGEREFFTPVRNDAGKVIGYFERHEVSWSKDYPDILVKEYWKHRI